VKTINGETWCQSHLADQELHQLLEKVDADLAQEARQKGCLFCGGKLHCADYDRKPRGGVRNGINAIAFAAQKKIAGDGEPRNRCVSWDAGSMRA
jgi:hypothetical protein